MGWKALKTHYNIDHIVQVTEQGICIGTRFIHNLIIVDTEGEIKKRYDESNKDLLRYQSEMDADPETLKALVQSKDLFTHSLTVYTYQGADIIEKQCETLGYPNVTHEGEMLYENLFSDDRNQVIEWAKESAQQEINYLEDYIPKKEIELAKLKANLQDRQSDLEKLAALIGLKDSPAV